MNSAQEVWNSLYTNEVETIWKSERQELRKPAMIYYILKQEFQKIQDNLDHQMKQFEHQILSIEELESKEKCENVPMPLSDTELCKSPTINKQRNFSFKRQIPALKLDLSKENLILKREDLNVDIVESSPELNCIRAKQNELKTLFPPKMVSKNADVVDSSFIIENTPPINSFIKKAKHKKLSKKIQKKDKSTTLTQLFKIAPMSKSISNDTTLFNQISPECKKIENKLIDVSGDETFCDVKMETSSVLKKEVKNKFKDYDIFPIMRPKSPVFVHKTEPVRRKADRMQLPGWSCEDCRQFYESSNLPPEVLREKMNACSRHRNKFQPFDETFEGYWDVEMFPTQDEDI